MNCLYRYCTVILTSLIVMSCSDESAPKENRNSAVGKGTIAPVDGKALFSTHCAACHGNDGKAGIAGASDLQASRLDSASIFQTIRNGRKNMPAYKERITENEIKRLTMYVAQLKTK